MNKLRLFLTSFLVLSFALFSCSDNNEPEGGVEPPLPPAEHTYTTNLKATLGYTYKVTNSKTDEVLVDTNYKMNDINMLAVVFHNKSDGECKKLLYFNAETIRNNIKKDNFDIDVQMPEGEYYVTAIAFKDIKITNSNEEKTFLKSLTLKYDEAVAQVPNDYIHYQTTEIKVVANNDDNNQPPMLLEKITTDLIFEFGDAYKVPNSSGYSLTVGVENIPSAFFIATGKTLTAKEAQDRKLHVYTGERQVPVPPIIGKEAVVTTFHTLSNDNLPVADRGEYWFEFKEIGGKQIRVVSETLYKFTPDYSSSMYMYGLYDEAKPKVKTVIKED